MQSIISDSIPFMTTIPLHVHEFKDAIFALLTSDKYKEMVLGVENIIQVDFWDFGGQLIFYTTHPTYMSDRCLYFLVFDCSIGLKGEVRDPDVDTGVNINKTTMGRYCTLRLHWSVTGEGRRMSLQAAMGK